jgi:hypothetical protein
VSRGRTASREVRHPEPHHVGSLESDVVDETTLLEERCQAPRCGRPYGNHSPEQITACIERWLLATTADEATACQASENDTRDQSQPEPEMER